MSETLVRPVFVGIDPGKTGGFAVMDERGAFVWAFSPQWQPSGAMFPESVGAIRNWVDPPEGTKYHGRKFLIAIEEPIAYFGGIAVPKSAKAVAVSYGVWLGVLSALHCDFVHVPPKTWQHELGIKMPRGTTSTERKASSVDLAIRMFGPVAESVIVGPQGGRKDGLAEALLLCEFRRKLYASGRG